MAAHQNISFNNNVYILYIYCRFTSENNVLIASFATKLINFSQNLLSIHSVNQ